MARPSFHVRTAWKSNAEKLDKFLREFIAKNNRRPSVKEIISAGISGLKTQSAVSTALRDLENSEKGD